MSHIEGIRAARSYEIGEFTLRCRASNHEALSKKNSLGPKPCDIDGALLSIRQFRPYTEVLNSMKAKLSKQAILSNAPKAQALKPKAEATFVKKSRGALSETNASLHKTTLLNLTEIAPARQANESSNPPTAKKFMIKLQNTETTEFDLMSTLKRRDELKRSRTYSQIHRDKTAFVRASQLGLNRCS